MTRLGTSEETGMNETPPWSAPGPWPRRRCVLTLALGVVALPVAGVVGAQPDDPRRVRPQANDRFVFAGGNGKGRVITDRKSTRLNSSHPSTSYAVFCLKKKMM